MDETDRYLISECHYQAYARKQINKPLTEVKEINLLSIASIKQRIRL